MKPMNTTKPSISAYSQAAKVIEAIHGEYSCTVVRLKREDPTASGSDCGLYKSHGFCHGTLADQLKLFPGYSRDGIEPFLMAGVTNGEGTADANVPHSWALSVDFDHGYPDVLANPLVRPSLLIETSPGHFQAIWVMDAQCSAADAKPVLKAMALRLGGDVAYAKASQLIRLPGFLHVKRGTEAKLVEPTNLAKPYALDFLKAAFDVEFINNCIRAAMPRFNTSLELTRDKNNDQDAAHIIEDVESALPYLKPYAEEYMDWVSTLMALVPLGAVGKRLAEEFSRYSVKFTRQAFEKKWEAVQDSPGKVATIFLRAQNNGWQNPGHRNVLVEKHPTLTDRDLGRMIAAELGDSHAVTETYSGDKRNLNFLAWNDSVYIVMKEIDRRNVVEKAGKKVIADLIARGGLNHDTIVRLRHKVGRNRTLNEVCDHVADALVPESRHRIVGSFPYFWVANGVLNLLTQELVPSRYRPVPIKGPSPVEFDPTATAPIFQRVVREVFEDDEEVIRYFYQLIGYMTLGNQKEQIFVILFGPKAENGKSTIEGIVSYIMGGYATILTTTSIMTKSHVTENAGSSTSQLEGKRLAVVSEINDRHSLDSGAVKQMTGDLFMPVRKLYSDSETISIEFLLLMLTNKLPKVSADDHGLWRRMRIIPFNRKFTKEEIDPDLPNKLKKEAPGILNLMLAGARDYLLHGLKTPEKVLAAVGEQRKSVDPVASFLEETMVVGGSGETTLKTLYSMYETWREENPSFARLTKRELQKRMEELEFERRVRGNLPYFHGLRPIQISD